MNLKEEITAHTLYGHLVSTKTLIRVGFAVLSLYSIGTAFAQGVPAGTQLLNPPRWGYHIDIARKSPDAPQKTKDLALQANIPHDFSIIIEHVKSTAF